MKIEYADYKKELINHFKNNDKFKDFNFSGSNINILLDILGRNAHNYGIYATMLMMERNPQTARQLKSLQGYASRHSFLVKNNTSATTRLNVSVAVDDDVTSLYLPKDTRFSAVNENEQQLTFITLRDYTLTKKVNGVISGEITVNEGEFKTDTIEIDSMSKFYRIYNDRCDVDTLKVTLKDSASGNIGVTLEKANPNIIPKRTDNIYYITLNNNNYEISFGENIFGVQPKPSQIIKLEFLATNGANGNGASIFKFVNTGSGIVKNTNINHYHNIVVSSLEPSSGGYSGINKSNLKLALTNFSRVKSIAINDDDYKSIILASYNDISSIAVWGGEKNNYREYGKTFISIKPLYSKFLSNTVKENIREMLVKNYTLIGTNIVFVDPNYLYINTNIVFTKNNNSRNIDNGAIESDLIQKAYEYDKDYIGNFDRIFNENEFIEFIGSRYKNGYTNLYVRKELEYTLPLIFGNNHTYEFDFINPLIKFESEVFMIGDKEAQYKYDKVQAPESDIYLYVDGENKGVHGSVNLDTGYVNLTIPESVILKEIVLIGSPIDSTIETSFDRILQLGKINVEVR